MPSVNPKTQKSKRRVPDDFGFRIKTELLRRESSIAALARSLGKSRTSVSLAINHPTMFPMLKKRILAALKLAA